MTSEIARVEQGRGLVNANKKESLMATETMQQGELMAQHMGSEARAMIETRAVLAMRNPRSMILVEEQLVSLLKRRAFCERARYVLDYFKDKKGVPASGWSARTAEAVVSTMGNLYIATLPVFEDDHQRILRNIVLDLEKNASIEVPIVVAKTVERSKVKPGQVELARRENSQGQPVYLVAASESELLGKQNSAISKAKRNSVLTLLPEYVKDAMLEQYHRTYEEADKANPEGELKRLVAAFAGLNIGVASLAKYLGHPIEKITQEERMKLRGIYAALRDDEMDWAEILRSRGIIPEEDEVTGLAPDATASERLASKVGAKVQAQASAPSSPVTQPEPAPKPAEAKPLEPADELAALRVKLDTMLGEGAGQAWTQAECVIKGKMTPEKLATAIVNARNLIAEIEAANAAEAKEARNDQAE